ncbi:sigma factor-like helix-turn-helix DNA-binding protein [Hymenobacter siberiensis]|uniref:sigma factor-like helix-turn-helix DNA-binding protein n=1 Tax=Hymenobacter siberiensis TaxID=2848396 RepID=UPI001D03216E
MRPATAPTSKPEPARSGAKPREWAAADTQLEQRELAEQLLGCQGRLPAQHQAVFSLRFVEEMSGEEICQQLAISPANYWVSFTGPSCSCASVWKSTGFRAPNTSLSFLIAMSA